MDWCNQNPKMKLNSGCILKSLYINHTKAKELCRKSANMSFSGPGGLL